MYYLLDKKQERALYKKGTRYYRSGYPIPDEKGFKLYKVKRITTILSARESLYEYCKEWFDVYDENGKIDLEKYKEINNE